MKIEKSSTATSASHQPRKRYRDTLVRLQHAQKAGRGPAYLRYVNRRLGRPLAAAAYHFGLTPNAVTGISAVFTFGGLALLATAQPSEIVGVAATVLLLIGFALDSADGQLARLRGGGSRAGEWLDHVVDAVKVPSIHLAVLISVYRSGQLADAWLLVPVAFSIVDSVGYFAHMLSDQLTRHGGGNRRPSNRLAASLLLLPTDYGVLCLSFLLLGSIQLFMAVYTALFVLRTAILVRALVRQYRDMRGDRSISRVTDVPTVRILGTHGVPAAYGGFETAAQCVGLHLREQGWRVIVYCQIPGDESRRDDRWRGLERVCIPESRPGWRGTSAFDLQCVRHVLKHDSSSDVCLTFGYNTGVFNIAQRLRGIPNVINMDGMEWTRRRWGFAKQGILLANERIAGMVGDVLIADHPEIADYLSRHFGTRRVTTITYGAYAVNDAPTEPIRDLGLVPGDFATMICRPIPENSVEEIVTAWSARRRGIPLVVLGDFLPDDAYHGRVQSIASDEVMFPGAIYDPQIVSSLRYHSRLYLHGHTVGGTNPSLVEAMAAGNPVVAHDNPYNTWVAGDGARYFRDTASLIKILDDLVDDTATQRAMQSRNRTRFAEEFTWDHIGSQYETALRTAMLRHGRNTDAAPTARAEEDAK